LRRNQSHQSKQLGTNNDVEKVKRKTAKIGDVDLRNGGEGKSK